MKQKIRGFIIILAAVVCAPYSAFAQIGWLLSGSSPVD